MSDDNWWESEADDYQSTTNRVWKAESGEHDIKASDLPPPPPPPPARPPPLPPGWSSLAASESSLSPPHGSAPISSPLSPTARPSATPLQSYPSALSTATTDHSDDEEDDDFSSHASGATKSSAAPDAWVEVRDVASDRVYWINPATQRISTQNPHPADGSAPTAPTTETMDASELTGLDDSIDIRRNSMILGSAWDDTGGYESKAHSAHAVDVGNTFTGNLRTARKNTMSSQMLKLLNGVSTKVELFVDMATELTPAVAEHLQVIRERIAAIQELLENEGNNVDSRDDVTALVEFDKLKWDFNSDEVAAFRARAVRVPHDKYEYKNWHMPQFFTNKPMPAILIQPREKEKEWSILCTVKLPVSPEETMQSTRISLTVDDTAESAIHKAFAKYKGTTSLGPESGYVLKAIGFRDFMEGSRRLLSYEYIRDCLHDGQQHLELVLAPKPAPLPAPAPEEKDKLPSAYKAKVDPETKVLTIFDYTNVTTKCDWEDMKSIPISELNLPFRVKINGVEGVSQEALPRYDQTMSQLLVKAVLFHGEETLQIYQSRAQPSSANPRWMEWLTKGVSTPGVLTRDLMYPQIPRASRVVFLVYGQVYEKLELLGWVTVQLIDQYGRLRSGPMSLKLWKMDTNRKEAEQKLDFLFRSTTRDNQSDEVTALLTVEFDEFLLPVVAPLVEVYHEPNPAVVGLEIPESKWDAKVKKQLKLLIEQDVLYSITPPDRTLIWSARHALTKMPYALPKLLQSVDWTSQEHRMEVYRLLKQWTPFPNPAHALELLDSKYADYTVREYAVNCLRSLADDDLAIYLLQLVQCLKFEPYHDSPLARFLIERSILNPYQIGHYFFWHVKAEIAVPDFCERFAVVLEEYLSHAGDFAKELRKQATVVQKLQRVAEFIAKGKNEDKISDTELMKKYRAELEKLNRDFQKMGSFPVPLNPKLQATTLIVEKCRYMSSKKVPLWLVFNNADKDAAPIYVIFKSGDDLRQDILTLQLLRIMDSIWLNEGLDMRLKPYRCLATGVNDEGEGVGMIEVVLNSDTTSGIQLKYGGGAMGALRMEPLDNFLRDHNKSPDAYNKAVENFIHSCAGYCVATFVMGIGDRHNGNIMVTKDGHLFHIDFGHFLGNFKKKFGINRERAAFVFTPEMAYVMGGAKYKKSQLFKDFKDLSCKAFNVLRKHGAFLETLFMLMVAAGMPELMKVDDVTYLREKLLLGMNEKEAEKAFKDEIKKSLDTTWRRIDNAIHNLKHG